MRGSDSAGGIREKLSPIDKFEPDTQKKEKGLNARTLRSKKRLSSEEKGSWERGKNSGNSALSNPKDEKIQLNSELRI